jgi:hypothetical protein
MAGTTLQAVDLVYSVWRPAPPVGKIVGHRGELTELLEDCGHRLDGPPAH